MNFCDSLDIKMIFYPIFFLLTIFIYSIIVIDGVKKKHKSYIRPWIVY